MYGKGVYFARESEYSARTAYSVPDKHGVQYMFLCRVVIGEYCQGVQDALTPAVRPTWRDVLVLFSHMHARSSARLFHSIHPTPAFMSSTGIKLLCHQQVRQGHQLYDSTVNNVGNPQIFVTYHDAQAYPEYLVRFKQ